MLGYFRITFGGLSAGMESALVLVVLYGVGTNSRRLVGAGWGLNLIFEIMLSRSSLIRLRQLVIEEGSSGSWC